MSEDDELIVITPPQQQFIEALLMGRNITQASLLVGVSRRTGCNWMTRDNPVRYEYDVQRAQLAQQFHTRISKLHDMALKTLEDMLSSDQPPWIRIQVAKLIYETQLKEHCQVTLPKTAGHLLQGTINNVWQDSKDEDEFAIQSHMFDKAGEE